MILRILAVLRGLDRALLRVETGALAIALVAMVVLAFADVILRNTVHASIEALPIVSRHLVLWVGMIGASLAAAERKHIAIELFAPALTPNGRRVVEGIVDVATIFVCAFLAYVAWAWIGYLERPDGALIPGTPIRRWWSLSVIPAGFAVMAARFARLALDRIFVEEPVAPAVPAAIGGRELGGNGEVPVA